MLYLSSATQFQFFFLYLLECHQSISLVQAAIQDLEKMGNLISCVQHVADLPDIATLYYTEV